MGVLQSVLALGMWGCWRGVGVVTREQGVWEPVMAGPSTHKVNMLQGQSSDNLEQVQALQARSYASSSLAC